MAFRTNSRLGAAVGASLTWAALAVWLTRQSLHWESLYRLDGWMAITAGGVFASGLLLAFWTRSEFLSIAAIVGGGLAGWVAAALTKYHAHGHPSGYLDLPAMYYAWEDSAWIVIGAGVLGAACRWIAVDVRGSRTDWWKLLVVFLGTAAAFSGWWGVEDLLGKLVRWRVQPGRVVVIVPALIGFCGAAWTGTAALTTLALALGVVSGLELAMLIPIRPTSVDWAWDGLLATSVPLITIGALGALGQRSTALARRRGAMGKYLAILGVTATAFAWEMAPFAKELYHQSSIEWGFAAIVAAVVVGLGGTIWTRSAPLALAAVVLGLQVGWEIAEISYFPPIDGIWNWMALIGRNLIAPLSVAGVIGAALGWALNTALRRSTDEEPTTR
jgi:hypothetical protein